MPKPHISTAIHRADSPDSLGILIESNNGWSVALADWEYLKVSAEVEARFWSKVNREGPTPIHRPELGPCWDWTASLVRGYGQFVLPRDEYGTQAHLLAHRFSLELTFKRRLPSGAHACHHCDRPSCVRPTHMFVGSQANNLTDARRKGRLIDGAHLIKLSADDLATIRREYRPRKNGQELATRFGISMTTLMRVVAGTQRVAPTKQLPNLILERVPSVQLVIRGEVA